MRDDLYLLLDLKLALRAERSTADGGWWRTDPAPLGPILRAAAELDLIFEFRHAGPEGSKRLTRFGSLEELIEQTRSWEERDYQLHRSAAGGIDDSSLSLSLREAIFRVQLQVAAVDLATRRETICDQLIALTERIAAAFDGRGSLAEACCIRVPALEGEGPRPPREHPVIAVDAPVAFVDPTYLVERGKRFPEEHLARDLARLQKAKMPSRGERRQSERLLIFRWLDQPLRAGEEEAQILEASDRAERWFGDTLQLPPPDGWNEHGDRAVEMEGFVPSPPLTLYSESSERGYKTVAATKGGKVPPGALEELAAWIAAGVLPDGRPLAALGVIVPAREAALNVREQAIAAGVTEVVYTDRDGTLWNPFFSDEGSE